MSEVGANTTGAAPAEGHGPQGRPVPIAGIILVVVGAVLSLASLAPIGGGTITAWAYATQRDDDGFFTTPTERLETATYAITSDDIDLGADPSDRDWDLGDVATVRLEADSTRERGATFVGIGPEDDVARYLEGVATAQVDDLQFDPFSVDYRYTDGGAPPGPPGAEDFWVAEAEGEGRQTLEWPLESGTWTVVVMNADGADGVTVDASVGAKVDWIVWAAVLLLVIGSLALLVGALLLVFGVILLARGSDISLAGTTPVEGQPVRLTGHLDEPLSRWLWLVKWVLLIPHLIVLVVLWLAFFVVSVVAFFAILFTARYPQKLFEFNVGVMRWTWRVTYYGYSALGTDRYPPFSLGHEPDYPATFEVDRPDELSRGLVLVKWWLLAIPHYLVIGFFGGGLAWGFGAWGDGTGAPFGGLIGLLVVIAGVALLFTGAYPRSIHPLVVGLNRWVYRVVAYAGLLRDEYPPFRLDQGAEEPEPVPPAPTSPEPTEPAADAGAGSGDAASG